MRSSAASGSSPSVTSTGGRPRSTRHVLKAAVDAASQARPEDDPAHHVGDVVDAEGQAGEPDRRHQHHGEAKEDRADAGV